MSNIIRTTANSDAIRWNFYYLKTMPGLLQLGELILGIISVSCVASEFYLQNVQKFFVLMAATFMMGTFCLLLSSVTSWRNSRLISETTFYPIYHAVATILLPAASITLVANYRNFIGPDFSVFMAGSIIGLINSVLYFASANFAYMGLVSVQTGSGSYKSNAEFAGNKDITAAFSVTK